ncbi:MAG: hypothetical protein LBT45_02495 [Rickettsiales bacterium]|jgi:hypothetical protein|nr:hypothetical protein [Rickettsiales bacterium]
METLTTEHVENLNNLGWDDTVGDIRQYAPEERAFIVDSNIRATFKKLLDDENAPPEFANIRSLYRALKAKGLRCCIDAFSKRINPNRTCNREAGIPRDLSISDISPSQLRPFEAGITNWTGYFNYEFYELASTLLPSGFLLMESREKISKVARESHSSPEYRKKISKAAKERYNSPEYRKKISKAAKESHSSPEYKERMSKATKEMWDSPEYREKMKERYNSPEYKEKMSKAAKKQWSSKKESLNKEVEAEIGKLPPADTIEKTNVVPVAPGVVAKTDARPANVLEVVALSSCFNNGR